MSVGAVVYAKDVHRVAAFYAALGGWTVVTHDGYATVDAGGYEIAIVQVPADIAATFTIADPPDRRVSTPVKIAIVVPTIAAARVSVQRLGGVVDAADREWRFGANLVCDGHDPEGNVFQLRQSLATPPD